MLRSAASNVVRLGRAPVFTVAIFCVMVAFLAASPPAWATTFTVHNTSDSGAGSLRQAITDANSNPGQDTITFAPSIGSTDVGDTIALRSALPDLSSVSIEGPGAERLTVQPYSDSQGGFASQFRVFTLGAGATVSIEGLTMSRGWQPAGDGGALFNPATGSLEIVDSVVTGSRAVSSGGGVYNEGTLTLTGSSVSGNQAASSGGGVYNEGTLTLTDSSVCDNRTSLNGGGIFNAGGAAATLADSTVCRNEASSSAGKHDGGGVFNEGALTIKSSTFSANSARNNDQCTLCRGGAISNSSGAALTMTNATVSANGAADGAGIYSGGQADIVSATITANYGTMGGGIFNEGSLTLGNSIVARNDAAEQVNGTFTAGGANLVGGDPKLGPLQDNGGPTQTHFPLPESPAIDQGFSKNSSSADQRGVPRPQDDPLVDNPLEGDGSDVGAVEAKLPKASIDDVTVNEGNGGTTNATFTVELSESEVSSRTVRVGYATQDDEATSPADYASANGALAFTSRGEAVSKAVTISVQGDASDEPTETFFLDLGGNTQTEYVADRSAVGIIRDDDNPPALSVSDASVSEPTSGSAKADFQVTLPVASGKAVSVEYDTSDGTATTGDGDYSAASGTLYFNPGTTSKSVPVPVNSDTKAEPQESFFVSLSSPENATLARDKGEGTIENSTPADEAPTTGADSYSTGQDQPLRVAAPGLLGNDADPEGASLKAVEATDPAHGEVFMGANGSFAYFPEEGYLGVDSFTYRASDGPNSSDPATVEISVEDVTPPAVLSMTPPKKRSANITIQFSEPMDPATLMQDGSDPVGEPSISESVLLLKGKVGSTTQVPARVSCTDATCQTVVLNPDVRLGARKPYTVRVEGTASSAGSPVVTDMGGNGLVQDYVKSFRTGRR